MRVSLSCSSHCLSGPRPPASCSFILSFCTPKPLQEFADFLKQVDVDAAAAAAQKAAEDAEEAADKQDREEFEHMWVLGSTFWWWGT